MLELSHHTRIETIGVVGFSSIALFHLGLRMLVKVRKARLRPRGEIHQEDLFKRMVAWYVAFWALAMIEWSFAPWPFRWSVACAGAALYVLAGFLQWRAFQDLGDAYSPDIEVRPEQKLVQKGLYRIVRHPLLTALVIELLGVTLFLNAYIVSLTALVVFVQVVKERMQAEEEILVQHFGDGYRRYSMHVGGLFPKMTRLKS